MGRGAVARLGASRHRRLIRRSPARKARVSGSSLLKVTLSL
ncbi:hypothetical protein CZ774_12350 [Frigoribacterium sp. JB110]|nr:hypothetical protein CZ774_12350 [Frigoribacterium sp. JB110]